MAVIKGGQSEDLAAVDPISKALHISQYDLNGFLQGQKPTFRACTNVLLTPALTAGVPWFAIRGSSTKTIRVQRIVLSGLSLTTKAYVSVFLANYSTNHTGGTSTLLGQTPLDSTLGLGTAGGVEVFTVSPTPGAIIGRIASRRVLALDGTPSPTSSAYDVDEVFDFRNQVETSAIVLRGTTQELALGWIEAPTSAVSMHLEVEWTEEEVLA